MRQLHIFGPALLLIALAAFTFVLVQRARTGNASRSSSLILWLSGGGLTVLLILYSWAMVWVIHVARYIH